VHDRERQRQGHGSPAEQDEFLITILQRVLLCRRFCDVPQLSRAQ
jgi:hypothetical protein